MRSLGSTSASHLWTSLRSASGYPRSFSRRSWRRRARRKVSLLLLTSHLWPLNSPAPPLPSLPTSPSEPKHKSQPTSSTYYATPLDLQPSSLSFGTVTLYSLWFVHPLLSPHFLEWHLKLPSSSSLQLLASRHPNPPRLSIPHHIPKWTTSGLLWRQQQQHLPFFFLGKREKKKEFHLKTMVTLVRWGVAPGWVTTGSFTAQRGGGRALPFFLELREGGASGSSSSELLCHLCPPPNRKLLEGRLGLTPHQSVPTDSGERGTSQHTAFPHWMFRLNVRKGLQISGHWRNINV